MESIEKEKILILYLHGSSVTETEFENAVATLKRDFEGAKKREGKDNVKWWFSALIIRLFDFYELEPRGKRKLFSLDYRGKCMSIKQEGYKSS